MQAVLLFLALFSFTSGFTWTGIGYGVDYAFVGSPAGKYNVFIGYSGYGVQAAWANHWVSSLNSAILTQLNVRHIYSVQGPADPQYLAKEIGNSKLVAHLLKIIADGNLNLVFVAGHSSGSFVAHEFLGQITGGLDPNRHLQNKVVYFNLDGGSTGYTSAISKYLIKTYFVYAHDPNTGTNSPNAATMQFEGGSFGAKAQRIGLSEPGLCISGAIWCLHMTMITTHPHFNNQASAQLDYGSIDAAHPVQTAWLRLTGYNPSSTPVAPGLCVTASPNVNMRSGTCTNSAVIIAIPKGASVQSVSCCTTSCGYSWRQIKYNGQTGYVANKYLTPCTGSLSAYNLNDTTIDPNAACADGTVSMANVLSVTALFLAALALLM